MNVNKILYSIRKNLPYWYLLTTGLSKIEVVPIEDEQAIFGDYPTACTDGDTTWYATSFFDKLKLPCQVFVAIHETLHIVLKHHLTMPNNVDSNIWNQALDFTIHEIIRGVIADVGKKVIAFPPREIITVCDDAKFDGMTQQAIYDCLIKTQKAKPQNGQPKPSNIGGVKPSPAMKNGNGGKTAADAKKSASEAISKVIQSAQCQADCHGIGTGALSKIAASDRKAPKNLLDSLADFVSRAQSDNRSWNGLDRRLQSYGIQVPMLWNDGTENLVFAIDTSGSVGDYWVASFESILSDVCSQCSITKFTVAYFLDTVTESTEYETGDDYSVKINRQSGGTNFQPVVELANEIEATAVIFLTDGFAPTPKNNNCPLLFACSELRGMQDSYCKRPFESIFLDEFKN